MHILFFCRRNAFFWDRCSSLCSQTARRDGIEIRSIEDFSPPCGRFMPVFCRFSDLNYARLCRLLGIPYAADVDDLYWALPEYSSDPAAKDSQYLSAVDSLVRNAALVTTTTEELKINLVKRYPAARVMLIENAPPALYAPHPAAVIANTDNFKMNSQDLGWFPQVTQCLLDAGCAVQLIGKNDSLFQGEDEFLYHCAGPFAFLRYHRFLAERHFSLALIPVSASSYSDSKSAIKAMEFIARHIKVIASDILPYRRLKEQYPDLDLVLAPNRPEAWLREVQARLASIPADTLSAGRASARMLFEKRRLQYSQWRAVCAEYESFRVCPLRYFIFALLSRLYRLLKRA